MTDSRRMGMERTPCIISFVDSLGFWLLLAALSQRADELLVLVALRNALLCLLFVVAIDVLLTPRIRTDPLGFRVIILWVTVMLIIAVRLAFSSCLPSLGFGSGCSPVRPMMTIWKTVNFSDCKERTSFHLSLHEYYYKGRGRKDGRNIEQNGSRSSASLRTPLTQIWACRRSVVSDPAPSMHFLA